MTRLTPTVAVLAAYALLGVLFAPRALSGVGWRYSTASAYSTADSAGPQGCPHSGPLRDDMLTFASLIVPCGTRVTFCVGHRCVTARRTDSGPYANGRVFDLALGTVRKLGYRTPTGFGVLVIRWRRT